MKKGKEENPVVDILLSTYNGGMYLKELLESILAQSYVNWRLLIRDDGSDDNTLDILKGFPSEKIIFNEDKKKHLGSCQSFSELAMRSTADYVMFCDQDDVWLPEKIESTLKKMVEAEAKHGDAPILIYTDMMIVDSGLKTIARSFWRYQHLNPGFNALNHLLVMNVATGCTMMINRKLKESACPIPQNIPLHDWWITIVATVLGRIEYIDSPTILHRQHENNSTGAFRYPVGYFIEKIADFKRTKHLLRTAVGQSKIFSSTYHEHLSEKDRLMLNSFSSLFHVGRIGRTLTLLKFRFTVFGFFRNAGVFMLWLTMKKSGEPDQMSQFYRSF